MTLRARIFFVISLVVLIVLAISIVLLVARRRAAPLPPPPNVAVPTAPASVSPNAGTPGPAPAVPAGGVSAAPAISPEDIQRTAAKQLAKTFVERYNTYSTDNKFQNIRDVQLLVTASFWKKIAAPLAAATPAAGPQPFVSVSTMVITDGITTWKGDSADLELRVRRTANRAGSTSQKYQTIDLTALKQGANWLVDNYAVQP